MFDISDPLNINDHEKHSLVVIELFERTNWRIFCKSNLKMLILYATHMYIWKITILSLALQ